MSEQKDKGLQVQCFVKHDAEQIFTGDNVPRLLYVSRQRLDASRHPRIMHAHEDYTEVVLITEGASNYLVDHRQYAVKKGDLLVYNPGIVHDEVAGAGTEVETWCVAVGGLRMPGLPENALLRKDKGCVFRAGVLYEQMDTLCKMMFELLSGQFAGAATYCYGLMTSFLSMALAVAEHQDQSLIESEEEESVLGNRVKRYIDAHFREPLTLQTIADDLNVSTYYMAHVFKDMCGYAPMTYLQKRRIGEAQTMLIHTKKSISEIAYSLGYDAQSHFNLQFSKHVGMPPGEFRKQYVVSKQEK
ncbi:MAG: helix-turn-helix transcriptional regulator [Lachnospiraceae bacterium]|nr:helix-turn-helix transcriptional regulator [Lachnospiraceae bacterium]MDO4408077.1 AraC family transcriptional regulator [Eubacteriales bacterium]